MIFYFNHTIGIPSQDKEPIVCFEQLMLNYRKLAKKPELHIEKGIVTQESPTELAVNHLNLNDLIKGVRDKDLKRWIYSQFDKFPADLFYKMEEVYKEYAELDYSYYVDGKGGDRVEATHLLAPARLGWGVLTMPVSDVWLGHEVVLKAEGIGEEQSADINRATRVCKEMIAKRNLK